jgi:hypothetical protein
MRIRRRMALVLILTAGALAPSLAAFFACTWTSRRLQELRLGSCEFRADIFRFRFLSDEMLTSTSFDGSYE